MTTRKYGNKDISKLFLNPENESISSLLHYIKLFWSDIEKLTNKESPRMYLNEKTFGDLKEFSCRGLDETILSKKLSEAFEGCVRWNDDRSMFNVTPSPLIPAVAGATIANLINPNAMMDFTAGKILNYEREIIRHLASMAGMNQQECEGLFVSGGKITSLYAIKVGLLKCSPSSNTIGVKEKFAVISSEKSHYTIESNCGWLGIGSESLLRIKAKNNDQIDLNILEATIRNLIERKVKIACIVLNAGSTTSSLLDPLKKVFILRNRIAEEYNLDYSPHIHLDSVIGWLWLYHPENICINNSDINFARKLKKEIKYVDSFGVDFHKTGLSQYVSSIVIFKRNEDLARISGDERIKHGAFGQNFTKFFSLEHSRSAAPIISTWIVFNYLGINGMKDYLVHLLELTQIVRENIANNDFVLLNESFGGFSTIISPIINNKNTSAKIYEMSSKEVTDYNITINHFYNFLFSNNRNGFMDWPYLGFVPNFDKTKSGVSFHALRLQTNSPFLNKNKILKIWKDLSKAKKTFTKIKASKGTNFYQPK